MAHRKFRDAKRHNKEEAKKKLTRTIISIFFVGLMVFSVLGIYVSNQQTKNNNQFKYDEYVFDLVEISPEQSALSIIIDNEEKIFYSLPQDVLLIPVEGNITRVIGSTGFVSMVNTPSVEAAPLIDLMRFDFDRYAHVFATSVPLNIDNITESISCLNATAQSPVIILVESNVTKIVVEDSCIKIDSKPEDLFLIRDRLLFSFLNIITE